MRSVIRSWASLQLCQASDWRRLLMLNSNTLKADKWMETYESWFNMAQFIQESRGPLNFWQPSCYSLAWRQRWAYLKLGPSHLESWEISAKEMRSVQDPFHLCLNLKGFIAALTIKAKLFTVVHQGPYVLASDLSFTPPSPATLVALLVRTHATAFVSYSFCICCSPGFSYIWLIIFQILV